MGRKRLYYTPEEKRLSRNRDSKKWYANIGHVHQKHRKISKQKLSPSISSVESDDDCDGIDESQQNIVLPPQLPLSDRLFNSHGLPLNAHLQFIYSIIFLAFLSSNISARTLSFIYLITKLILVVNNVRGPTQNRFSRLLEHYRDEMIGPTTKIYYCKRCKQIISAEYVDLYDFVCECGFLFQKKDNYFSVISIRHCLTSFLESTADKLHYFVDTNYADQHCDAYYRCSGVGTRRLRIRNDSAHRDLAVDLFIDNAMVKKSGTKSSMTVVQISVANSTPYVCRSRIILAAVWYARTPDDACPYNTILSVVVDELLNLFQHPIVWRNGNQIMHSRVLLRAVIADMKAKASVLGMKQTNGYYSCPYCTQEGTTEQKYKKIRIPLQRGTRKQARHDRVQANMQSSSSFTSQVRY